MVGADNGSRALVFRGTATGLSFAVTGSSVAGTPGSSRVRSGLMTSQLWAPFEVLKSTLPAKNSTCGSTGENTIGCVRTWRPRSAETIPLPRPPSGPGA